MKENIPEHNDTNCATTAGASRLIRFAETAGAGERAQPSRESTEAGRAAPVRETSRGSVVLSATFTVDPLVGPLSLLLGEAGLNLGVTVAPYGQIFQELLDPTRLFAANRDGVNVLLVRFSDWLRDVEGGADRQAGRINLERNVRDLAAAVRLASSSSPATFVVCVCPSSPSDVAAREDQIFFTALETRLAQGLIGVPNARLLTEDQIGASVVDPASLHDAERDRLAHIPYQPIYFAALGRALGRLLHALRTPPHKVIVLDCDNTLWKGVVGEDGAHGVEISEAHRHLHTFVVGKKHAGMIICLASKNVESDVLQVFEQRQEMVLKLEDIVATRINWLPKSQNLHTLAAELNLGLDSFVFVDDNPVECAEVSAACPGTLVLNLPEGGDPAAFLRNVWPLDQINFTEEDGKRTELYRQNLERDRYQRAAPSIGEFVAGLELSIFIAVPREDQMARVAQLTQRTNQFNVTTIRRTEAELRQLAQQGLDCRAVEVRDRFGDYGLVGVMIFGTDAEAVVVDTMLLSCRVLGRGVEHAMVRTLGQLARERALDRVVIPFRSTSKNQAARQFLDGLADATRDMKGGADGTRFSLLASLAETLAYTPGAQPSPVSVAETPPPSMVAKTDAANDKSARWNRIARHLGTPEQILAAWEQTTRRSRPMPASALTPSTDTERHLAAIWAATLGLAAVGVRDDYFALGGTSLQAATIFARIERELGQRLPLAALVECPTVEALAARLDRPSASSVLVVLQEAGAAPPLFLVHDADGETLLYRNLARRLGARRPVYGVQPLASADAPMVHTRIEQMAAHYVAEIRKVQPRGPYLLGGLCAGGILAFEMALQLEAEGQEARLVAVFDAADVSAPLRPRLHANRRLRRLSDALSSGPPRAVPRLLLDKSAGFLRYQIDSRTRRWHDRMAVTALEFCLQRGLPVPGWVSKVSVRTVYAAAEARYRPSRRLRREIVLFRASTGDGRDEPYAQLYDDPLLGWAPRSDETVRAFDVPGGHSTMLQEPNVGVLATLLRSYLGDQEMAEPRVAPAANDRTAFHA